MVYIPNLTFFKRRKHEVVRLWNGVRIKVAWIGYIHYNSLSGYARAVYGIGVQVLKYLDEWTVEVYQVIKEEAPNKPSRLASSEEKFIIKARTKAEAEKLAEAILKYGVPD